MLAIDARFGNTRTKTDDDFFSRVVRQVAESCVYSNLVYLEDHPLCPPLMTSGVQYRNEPLGQVDECVDIPIILERGWGDCLHLTCWRVAELRRHGEQAEIAVKRHRDLTKKIRMFHVLVRRSSGETEDISRLLGM